VDYPGRRYAQRSFSTKPRSEFAVKCRSRRLPSSCREWTHERLAPGPEPVGADRYGRPRSSRSGRPREAIRHFIPAARRWAPKFVRPCRVMRVENFRQPAGSGEARGITQEVTSSVTGPWAWASLARLAGRYDVRWMHWPKSTIDLMVGQRFTVTRGAAKAQMHPTARASAGQLRGQHKENRPGPWRADGTMDVSRRKISDRRLAAFHRPGQAARRSCVHSDKMKEDGVTTMRPRSSGPRLVREGSLPYLRPWVNPRRLTRAQDRARPNTCFPT